MLKPQRPTQTTRKLEFEINSKILLVYILLRKRCLRFVAGNFKNNSFTLYKVFQVFCSAMLLFSVFLALLLQFLPLSVSLSSMLGSSTQLVIHYPIVFRKYCSFFFPLACASKKRDCIFELRLNFFYLYFSSPIHLVSIHVYKVDFLWRLGIFIASRKY